MVVIVTIIIVIKISNALCNVIHHNYIIVIWAIRKIFKDHSKLGIEYHDIDLYIQELVINYI